MRNQFPLFFISVLVSISIFGNFIKAQSLEVIDYSRFNCYYTYEFVPDSTNTINKISVNMILQVGQRTSRFLNLRNFHNDSLVYYTEISKNHDAAVAQLLGNFQKFNSHVLADFDIYKNYPKEGDLLSRFTSTDRSKIESYDNEVMNWMLHNGRDTAIAGYRCQMATIRFRGRNYEAWFTPDVPVSDGPFKFRGLPGLIVLVYDEKGHHKFTLTSITKPGSGSAILFKTNKHKELSPMEFVKAFYASMDYFLGKVQRDEAGIVLGKQDKANMLRRIKSWNNYIEKF